MLDAIIQKKVRISAPTAPLQQVTDAPTTGARSKLVRTICQHLKSEVLPLPKLDAIPR